MKSQSSCSTLNEGKKLKIILAHCSRIKKVEIKKEIVKNVRMQKESKLLIEIIAVPLRKLGDVLIICRIGDVLF